MDAAGLAVFATAYALAVASPGPGVTALVARVLGRGTRGSAAYVAGFVVGDLVWLLVAALGLAAVAHSYALAFTVIRWLGIAYLLYLAWRLWTDPVTAAGESADPRAPTGRDSSLAAFASSLALTLGNPKVILFFMALMPSIVDLTALTPLVLLELVLLVAGILTAVLSAYVLAAARARRFLTSPRAVKAVNRVCAGALVGASAAIATRA